MVKNSTEQKKQSSAQQSAEFLITEKECKKCGRLKKMNEFSKDKNTKDGFKSRCKKCISESRRKTACEIYPSDIPDGFVFCPSCKNLKVKNTDNFYKSKLKDSSKILICKYCRIANQKEYMLKPEKKEAQNRRHKEWRDNNREHVRAYSKKQKDKSRDSIREQDKEYRSRPEVKAARREYERRYYAKNREKMISVSCAYDSRVRRARPKWQPQKEINEYYLKAKSLGLEVDHIVPINSEIVCGLHCVDNFQMLTREENARKGNRYWPNMPE